MPLSPAWRTIVRDLTEKKKRLLKGLTGWLAGWAWNGLALWWYLFLFVGIIVCCIYVSHRFPLFSSCLSPSILFKLVGGGKDSTLRFTFLRVIRCGESVLAEFSIIWSATLLACRFASWLAFPPLLCPFFLRAFTFGIFSVVICLILVVWYRYCAVVAWCGTFHPFTTPRTGQVQYRMMSTYFSNRGSFRSVFYFYFHLTLCESVYWLIDWLSWDAGGSYGAVHMMQYRAFPSSAFRFTSRTGTVRVLTRRPPLCTRLWQRRTREQGGRTYFVWALRQHRYFTIYFFDPCFRVLLAWDE